MSQQQRGESFSLIYAGFFLSGVVTMLLGPLIPTLELTWDLSHAELSWLFPAQFLGTATGSILSTRNLRRSLAVGYPLAAAGLTIAALGGWSVAIPAFALVGFGLGLVMPATNLLVAQAQTQDSSVRTSALATANLVWGLGAAGCPLFLGIALKPLGLKGFLGLLAALLLAAGTALAIAGRGRNIQAQEKLEEAPPASGLTPLLLLAAMFFFYIGVETAIGGWLVALAKEVGSTGSQALFVGSGFWVAFLLGRALVAAGLVQRFSETALYVPAMALAGLGILLLLFSPSLPGIALGTLLTGFALGPLFPFSVAFLAEIMLRHGARDTGWIFAIGGCGAAALPWLTGRLGGATGLQEAFVVPLGGLVILALLLAVFRPFLAEK